MKEHDLKCWEEPFDAIERGDKRFEWRKDDRGYQVYDILVLRRWNPLTDEYTGQCLRMTVTSITRGPACVIPRGYVIMSIAPEKESRQ